MISQTEMKKAVGQVAWDLVVQYQYPLKVVAQQLNRTQEQIQEMLLAALDIPPARKAH